jgi:hypothetical protein
MSNNGFPTISNDKLSSYSNLDKNLVLSPADMGETITVDNTNSYKIILPDATQNKTALFLIIYNKSTSSVANVHDNNGFIIKTIPPASCIIFSVQYGALNSSGDWSYKQLSIIENGGISFSSPLTVISAARYPVSVTALTPYSGIVTFGDSACAFTIDNAGSISIGSTYAIDSTGGMSEALVRAISPTQAVISYMGGASTYRLACVVTISGTTLSFGTKATISTFVGGNYSTLTCLSEKKLVFSFCGASGFPIAYVLTISGTSISVGTGLVYDSYLSGWFNSMAKLSDTKLICYYKGSSQWTVVMTVSGTTLTVGTKTSPVVGDGSMVCSLSPSLALLVRSNISLALIGISKTDTITLIQQLDLYPSNVALINCVIEKISSNKAILSFGLSPNGYPTSIVVTTSNTGISVGTAVTTTASTIPTYDMAMSVLSSSRAIIAYPSTSNYPKLNLITTS